MCKNTEIEAFIEAFVKNVPLSQIGKESEAKILPNGKSQLIFPKTGDGNTRFSEQETKILFVKELEKKKEFHYSVETPTDEKYKGFADGKPKQSKDGRSGAIDLTLHNEKGERIALIEFKHGMPKAESIEKDFLKLLVDKPEIEQNYFIHSVEKLNDEQINAVRKKYERSLENLKTTIKNTGEKSEVKIFLFAIEKSKIIVYKINKNLSLKTISEDFK